MELRAHWERATDLVRAHRDVLEARPVRAAPPAALLERGWSDWLLGLDDAQVDIVEISGTASAWPSDMPASLRAMVLAARDVCVMPAFPSPSSRRVANRGETPRKRAQIEALVDLAAPIAARAARVVDVGSGHGHLTRSIAERVARPVVGLERDRTLARRARRWSRDDNARFHVTDVLGEGLRFVANDCALGLHACGELGDAMVERAAEVGASVVLVGCCPQKRRAPVRQALVREGDPIDLPTRLLGLANLGAGDDGVEAERRTNLAARQRRLALHRLLEEVTGPLRFGAEMDGLNRRAAHDDLATLTQRAFTHRGLATPGRDSIDAAATWARAEHAAVRRLSLPRSLLARALEVFVLLDRASLLERSGARVAIGTVFPASVSARNLGLVAS